jgi:putative ABC transport system substrate-binding protein
MTVTIERRKFLATVGGAAAAWPLAARAQHTTPVVGFQNQGSADQGAPLAAAFRTGLNKLGSPGPSFCLTAGRGAWMPP